MTIEAAPKLSDDTYKNYSLDQLKTWVLDAIASEATPSEVVDCIFDALSEEKTHYIERISFINEVEKSFLNKFTSKGSKKDWDAFWEKL